MPASDPNAEAAARAHAAAHGGKPDALIEILHALQEERGFIAEEAIPALAKALNLSRAEVHGVVSFYHDFRREKPGRHVIKLCRAEACQAMGCDALIAHAERKLGVKLGETAADGEVTLEAVYCLGNCALSPAIMVDGELKGRVSPARFDAIIGELDNGGGP